MAVEKANNLYNSPYVANKIKVVAKSKKISLKDLLVKCELGQNTFSHMLHGRALAFDSLAKIADVLDCSVDYLLGRTDVPEINRKISFINDGDFTVVQKAAFDGGEVGGKNPDISKYGKILELTDKDN